MKILNEKERRTLTLLIAEVPTEEIRVQLGYEPGWVLYTRDRILNKLGASSLATAAVNAVKSGDLAHLQIPRPRVTRRQQLILQLIAKGRSMTAIATRLGLTYTQLSKQQLVELYDLFNVDTTPQLMLAAASCNLV